MKLIIIDTSDAPTDASLLADADPATPQCRIRDRNAGRGNCARHHCASQQRLRDERIDHNLCSRRGMSISGVCGVTPRWRIYDRNPGNGNCARPGNAGVLVVEVRKISPDRFLIRLSAGLTIRLQV